MITIDRGAMTSDLTGATCERRTRDGDETWTCTRLPGRLLTRAEAQTAMDLAEVEQAGAGGSARAAYLRSELGI